MPLLKEKVSWAQKLVFTNNFETSLKENVSDLNFHQAFSAS